MSMSDRSVRRLILGAVVAVVILIAAVVCVDVVNIEGNEVGIVHKYWGGVQDDVLRDGVHWIWLGKVNVVNIGTQKITFAPGERSNDSADEVEDQNEFEPITVNCGADGGQSAYIDLTVIYRLDPSKVVALWKSGNAYDYRTVLLKRAIIEAVNMNARTQDALTIYSGVGYNNLQQAIHDALNRNDGLSEKGILIDNATLYQVRLNPDYEDEIELKQLARQTRLRAIEDTAVAKQNALKAEAEAQIMVNERTAEAEAKAIEVTKAADAEKARRVVLAEAQKEEQRLAGEGQKIRQIAEAEGIEALGLAQARVEEAKKLAMYDGEAGRRRATVEVASALAEKLHGLLTGVTVIPSDAFVAISGSNMEIPLSLTDIGVGGGRNVKASD